MKIEKVRIKIVSEDKLDKEDKVFEYHGVKIGDKYNADYIKGLPYPFEIQVKHDQTIVLSEEEAEII